MLLPSNKQLRYMYFEYLLTDKINKLLEMGAEDWLLTELFSYERERENVEFFAKYLKETFLKHKKDSILDVSDSPHLSLARFLVPEGCDVSFFGIDDHLKYMSSQFLGIKHYINGDIKNHSLVSSATNKNQLINNIFFPLQQDRISGEATTILNYNFFNQNCFHTLIVTGESKGIPIIMNQNHCPAIAGFCGDINSDEIKERLKVYSGIVFYLNSRGSYKFYLSKDKDSNKNKEYYILKRK